MSNISEEGFGFYFTNGQVFIVRDHFLAERHMLEYPDLVALPLAELEAIPLELAPVRNLFR